MQLITAAFDRDINHGAGTVTILGRVTVALYTKFLDSIYRGQHYVHAIPAEASGMRVIVDPVQQIVVLKSSVSVNADRAAQPLIGVVGSAGNQQHQLRIIAFV